jgi:putative transposase
VKFAFILAEKAFAPVAVLCAVLGVSTSGFYAWLERGAGNTERRRRDAQLAVRIKAAHQASRSTYGGPRIHAELAAKGTRVSRKRVARIMREHHVVGCKKRRFRATTNSRHGGPIAPNRLSRRFTMQAPNQVWVTDVTAITTGEGWCYLGAMVDLYSRRVVGWRTSFSNDAALALDVLRDARRLRAQARGVLHHSDRGSPYASAEYLAALHGAGMERSMSRKGDCWDNAVAESFFATLRAELLDRHYYATKAALDRALADYIDGFYNLERRHSHLGYVSPIFFELRNAAA